MKTKRYNVYKKIDMENKDRVEKCEKLCHFIETDEFFVGT
jgi:hypothetical protein